jgi:hypothetical protein
MSELFWVNWSDVSEESKDWLCYKVSGLTVMAIRLMTRAYDQTGLQRRKDPNHQEVREPLGNTLNRAKCSWGVAEGTVQG